ncbi:hypothetical protein [Streptomyces sp. NPDC007172]|uniref:hypothetical protein n=1 Tax=Streptomyces sp. NPDC007172 TaxID=3364776 RepID=UPI0036B7FECA
MTHDSELGLAVVTNPLGLRGSYRCDPAGCLVSESGFDGGATPYEYDLLGRATARRGPLGDIVRCTRDAMDRVVGKDAAGAVRRETGGESWMKFENDPSGRQFEAVRDDYVAQAGPEGMRTGSPFP